jgi:cytochrome c oxidase cbb3-type subunit III
VSTPVCFLVVMKGSLFDVVIGIRHQLRAVWFGLLMLMTRRILIWLAVVVATCLVDVPVTTCQQLRVEPRSSFTSAKGRQILTSNCAACHGVDGKGSERAPNIAESAHARQLSDTELSRIIENGIPGTGMPAFHSLSIEQVGELIAYLRSLEGRATDGKLPGDPSKGEPVFFGKAGCSSCHMLAGRGGFIASDLTDYARSHSTEQIRRDVLEPGKGNKGQVRLVRVTLRSGDEYVGRMRSEDNFSLQLQSMDGTFHFIMKSDLAKLEYDSRLLMPDNFGSLLTPAEINDLISYLLHAAGNRDPQRHVKENVMDNLED